MSEIHDTDIVDVSDAVALDEDAGADPKVYEVGYHILPTVSEEAVAAEVEKLVADLGAFNIEMVGEKFPTLINLAYALEKKIDGTKHAFQSAYFGWLAFELSPAKIAEVKALFENNQNILRCLIVKTSRDAVAAALNDPGLDLEVAKQEGEVSEEALDDALQNLSEDEKPKESE